MAVAEVRARRGQPLLSRDAIITVARQIVEESGFEALSMRTVAKRLGVTPMPLYRHVDNRDHLVALVVAQLVDQGSAERRQWPTELGDVLRTFALRFHDVLCDHPEVLQAFMSDAIVTDTSCAAIDRVLQSLEAAGASTEEATSIYGELFIYVIGYVALYHGRTMTRRTRGESPDEHAARAEALIAGHAAGKYPHTYAARRELSRLVEPGQFERSIDRFVDGVRHRLVRAKT